MFVCSTSTEEFDRKWKTWCHYFDVFSFQSLVFLPGLPCFSCEQVVKLWQYFVFQTFQHHEYRQGSPQFCLVLWKACLSERNINRFTLCLPFFLCCLPDLRRAARTTVYSFFSQFTPIFKSSHRCLCLLWWFVIKLQKSTDQRGYSAKMFYE